MEAMARTVTSPKSASCSQRGSVHWSMLAFGVGILKDYLSYTSSGNLGTVFSLLSRKEKWYLETSRPFRMKFVLLPRICGRCSFIQARRHLFTKAFPETLPWKSYGLLSLKGQKLDSVAGSVSLWTLERLSISWCFGADSVTTTILSGHKSGMAWKVCDGRMLQHGNRSHTGVEEARTACVWPWTELYCVWDQKTIAAVN